MAPTTTPSSQGKTSWLNTIRAFRASLEHDGLSASTAQFKDKAVERAYTKSLVQTSLPSDLIFWVASIVGFFSYAILDVTTISENLREVLTIRLIFGSLMIGIALLILIPKMRPYFGFLTAGGLLASAIGIIWMIAIIPPEGAPPYIIGVLVVFIASSCLMRIPFRVAASVYLFSSLLYAAVLNFGDQFSKVDIISGHFFMVSIVMVAVFTNYYQEIRSRTIWLRDEQRKRDSEMIEKLLIEATAADQSKINFLSMMSHELRTPLHQIIGYTEVVTNSCKAANDMEDNVRHLNEIHGSAHVLLSRIQKMLRFVDATAGKMKYEMVDTPVSELVEVALERMRPGLERKSMHTDLSELSDATVRIDIIHTCYALNNIIENAINASPDDATLWISGGETADGGYELMIRDEGPGMTKEQITQALKPFTQGETALVRSREGLGLGLTLAKRIFEDQHASIALLSDGERGTTAKIRFEATKAKEEPVREKAAG